MVTLPDANVPAAVGVPVKATVLPLTTALNPFGKPVALAIVNGPAPLAIAMTPVNPDLPAVHALVVKLPRVGGALIVIV